MTFYEYMMKYLKRDTPAGDLARDMRRDKNFPLSNDGKEILSYFHFPTNACSECIDTFINCYSRYMRQELKRYNDFYWGKDNHEHHQGVTLQV